MPGESVKGHLPQDMIALLRENGYIEETQHDDGESNDPEANPVKTVEEFSNMRAAEQKALLQQLGMEPASNEEQRLQQYQEWLDNHKEGSQDAEL